jgi:hypothetical protein
MTLAGGQLAGAPTAMSSSNRSPGTSLRGGIAAAAIAWLGLAGCGQRPGDMPPSRPAPQDAGAKLQAVEVGDDSLKTGLAPADAALAARVKEKLATDPRLHGLTIEVDAQGGRVTLWGKVDHAEAKSAAEELARQTPGVRSLANLIDVRGGAS